MLKSIGKLTYSPRSHLANPQKWLVLMCDDSISTYYRHMFYKEFPWKGKLTRPVWGAHISVIRGEYTDPKLWMLDNNKIIEFEYEGGVLDNGIYYWLNVKCNYLLDLREKYNLSREPRHGLHMTIGLSNK